MGYEIDLIHVGDESRSGDAIAFRYGNLLAAPPQQTVCIVDGGTKESGQKLVDLVRAKYGTNHVDFVFSSHPDNDHVSGLTIVLEQMSVGVLFMHLPWNHADVVKSMLTEAYSNRALATTLQRALANAHDLYNLAISKGITVSEPFPGEWNIGDGSVTILGPSRSYYCSLVCDFRDTPEAKDAVSLLAKAFEGMVARVKETFGVESLDDTGVTSAENNSSVVLHVSSDGQSFLLTSDAGIPALTQAADFAAARGIDLTALSHMQVPHHGSKRNVGPTILGRLRAGVAFISAAKKGAPKHPAQRVVNALVRRGFSVYKTPGTNVLMAHNAPQRADYSSLVPLPFVEEYDE